MEKIKIGQIVNVIGLKGELKIYSYAESPERFQALENVFFEDEKFHIENVRIRGNLALVKVAGINDRNSAEKLKGKYVFMRESDLPELEEGEHYIKDIIGFNVILEDGENLGILKNIQTETSQNLYQIQRENEKKDVYIPGVTEFIKEIDTQGKTIVVKIPEGLLEL